MIHHELARATRDGRRYEVDDGEVALARSPLPRHQVVVRNLARLLEAFAEVHGGISFCAPLDLALSDGDVVQPDLMYFSHERRHLIDLDRPLGQIPDLIVEVLSAETATDDRGRRMQLFARHGVPEYWLVDPEAAAIDVHRLHRGRYVRVQRATGYQRVRSEWIDGLTMIAGAVFVRT
jgi:Uma2 family endonuclease